MQTSEYSFLSLQQAREKQLNQDLERRRVYYERRDEALNSGRRQAASGSRTTSPSQIIGGIAGWFSHGGRAVQTHR